MPERLSAKDASFWFMEAKSTSMQVGNLGIFQLPAEGFSLPRLLALVNQRIVLVPRYRKRIREVPFQIGRPLWVDDGDFELGHHVRRLVLPKPGTRAQLDELVGRLMSRPLDRTKPLWEMFLIEGLQGDTFAIMTKTHQGMIDTLVGIDIVQVILDQTDQPAQLPEISPWRPASEPSDRELITGVLSERLVHPGVALDFLQSALVGATSVAQGVGRRSIGILAGMVTFARPTAAPSASITALNITIGPERRIATADLDLVELHFVGCKLGGSVKDITLAVIAGALRAWLIGRGEPISAHSQLRVAVPISAGEGSDTSSEMAAVSACLVDLPIGESDPVVRLRQISYQLDAFENGSARLASNLSRWQYNLAVVSVPGPQLPVYVAGARLLRSYQVMPLPQNQSLCICLTTYDGHVYVGISADHASVTDLDFLLSCFRDASADLIQIAVIQGDSAAIGSAGGVSR